MPVNRPKNHGRDRQGHLPTRRVNLAARPEMLDSIRTTITRIEIVGANRQPQAMLRAAILLPTDPGGADSPAGRWLARAEQARRVARLLAPSDADIAEAYAIECEVQALRCVSSPYRRDVLAA